MELVSEKDVEHVSVMFDEVILNNEELKRKLLDSIDFSIDFIANTSTEIYKKYYPGTDNGIEVDNLIKIATCVFIIYVILLKKEFSRDLIDSLNELGKI